MSERSAIPMADVTPAATSKPGGCGDGCGCGETSALETATAVASTSRALAPGAEQRRQRRAQNLGPRELDFLHRGRGLGRRLCRRRRHCRLDG